MRRSFLIIVLLLQLPFYIQSCSTENVDSSNNNENETENGVEKKLIGFSCLYEDYELIGKLNYTNDKLADFSMYYNENPIEYEIKQNIVRSGDKVIMQGLVDGHNCKQTYTLNDNGYAESCISEYSYDLERNETKITYFTYSKDGFLLSHKEIDGYNNTYITNIEYDNGCIYSIEDMYNSGESDKYYCLYNSYTKNKSKIFPFEEDIYNYITAFYAGILGKAPEYMPDSYLNGEFEGEITYSLDKEGYIKSMKQEHFDYNSFYVFKYSD